MRRARELTRRQERFMAEARSRWGDSDAAIARWVLANDMDEAEGAFVAGLSAKSRGKEPDAKESLTAYQMLVEPALRYGLSPEAAALRRADRLSLLNTRRCSPLLAWDLSFVRRPGLWVGALFFDVFFGAAGLAVFFSLAAGFASGFCKWALYAGWAAALLYSFKWEPKARDRYGRPFSSWMLERLFPLKARLAAAQSELESELGEEGKASSGVVLGMLSKGFGEGVEPGARQRAWALRSETLAKAFVVQLRLKKESGLEGLSEETLRDRARHQALAGSELDELEAQLPLRASAPSKRRSL